MVYINSRIFIILIYSIKKAYIVLLLFKKITILIEYWDFSETFLKNLATMLFKYIVTNLYIINW